jgi:hypothetical protein
MSKISYAEESAKFATQCTACGNQIYTGSKVVHPVVNNVTDSRPFCTCLCACYVTLLDAGVTMSEIRNVVSNTDFRPIVNSLLGDQKGCQP